MVVASDLMEKDFLKIEKDSVLSQTIGKMVSSKKPVALVFDNDVLAGLVSIKIIARRTISNPVETKIGSLVETMPLLEETTPIEEIADLLFSSDSRVLPVVKNKFVIGVVSLVSVAKQIASMPAIKKIPLSRVIKNAVILNETDSVGKALALMREKNALSAAVVDKNSKLVGVVSLEEIVKKFLLFPKEKYHASKSSTGSTSGAINPEKDSMANTLVRNEMSDNFVSIGPNDTVLKAATLMASSNSSEIIAEENSMVLGIVSAKSILPLLQVLKPEKNIQIAKMPVVDEIDKAEILGFIDKAYDKISRFVPEEFSLHVHFKTHEKGGARKKHVVHLKLLMPKKTIVSKAVDWKLLVAVKNAANILERETIAFAKRK
jgi:CBS domain-containing protein